MIQRSAQIYEVCWKCSERCELICASHWGVRNLNLSVLMVVFVSSETQEKKDWATYLPSQL